MGPICLIAEPSILSLHRFDAASNMTNDGNSTLLYDAENHVVSASNGGGSGTYAYDGNGLRIKKVSGGTTTVTIYFAGVDIAEYQNGAAPNSPVNEYVNLGTQKILIFNSGTTTYYHNDHLSLRFRTNSSGTVVDQRGTYPFGETWYSPSGAPWMFTSYFRDTESGNDYAMARSYVNRVNRFSSPDPIGGSIPDPQSLNAYAYTHNNPINLVDPTGLFTSGPAPTDPFSGGPFDPWTPWENFGRGSSICTNWGLDDFNLPDIECSDFGPNMHPLDGGVGGSRVASLSDYKTALAKLLQNPDCAKWLGGSDVAQAVLGGLSRVVDASSGPSFTPLGVRDAQAAAIVNSGALATNTSINNPTTGVWNGFGYAVVGGSQFAENSFSAQLTVLVHEMSHVAFSGTPFGSSGAWGKAALDVNMGGNSSAAWISRDCGTAFPAYAPWQNEPTTSTQLPSTLQ